MPVSETVVSNRDATNNWGSGILSAPSVETNTIERFYDDFGRDAGYALNGVRQSTLAYDPAAGRIASMQIFSEESNHHSSTSTSHFNSFQWTYLAGSDLKSSLTYPNGLTASWTYGNRGELLEVNNASPTGTISKYVYTYDASGRRVGCDKSGSAFTQPDTIDYGYNARSELTNAIAAVDSAYRYAYDFDDIGNRKASAECGVQSAEYMSNELNQYTNIEYSAVSPATCHLSPTYDADGNQTLVKTATGIWQVTYNGENRPVLWSQGTNTISMTYDRMGRRVTKNDQRFVYNGYLQIANHHSSTSTSHFNYYIWDPTEPVATRPLVWLHQAPGTLHQAPLFYTHDGNKNVSEVITADGTIAAHYEYAPFGELTAQRGTSAAFNPWRFSSEYAEDDTATVYYNYRHYEPVTGRWLQRDPIEERGGIAMYMFVYNNAIMDDDCRGLFNWKIGNTSDRFDLGKKGTVVLFRAYSHYPEQYTSANDIAVAGADWDISVTCMCTNRTDVSKPVWTVASASGWWNPVRHIRDEKSYRTRARLKIIHDAEDQHINDHKQSLVGGALKQVVEEFLDSKRKYFKLTQELCEKENTDMLRKDVSNQLSVEVLVSHTKWDVGNGREHEVDWD